MDSGENAVILALNPVTKEEVKISPPFVWRNAEGLRVFCRNFEVYCQVAWHFNRTSPIDVDPSRWPNTPPRIIFDPPKQEPEQEPDAPTQATDQPVG